MTVNELIKELEEIKKVYGGDIFCYDKTQQTEISEVFLVEDICILKNKFE